MTVKRVAVVGASGFVGRHLVSALESRHIEVVVPHDPLGRRIDISTDVDPLVAAFSDVQVVVNAAGTAHDHSTNPADFWPANATGARNVARAVAANQGVQRLVHVSSVAVGSGGVEPAVANFAPFTAYGASKAAGEIAVDLELVNSTADLVIVRPAGIGGIDSPGAWGKIRRLIAEGKRVPVPAATVRHNVIEIDEVTASLARSATMQGPAGVFALAGPGPVSIEEYVVQVAAEMGTVARTVQVPSWALDPLLAGSGLVERATAPAIRAGRVLSTLTRQRPLVNH